MARTSSAGPRSLWLLIFFLVPLVTMLSLSPQTCDPVTLGLHDDLELRASSAT